MEKMTSLNEFGAVAYGSYEMEDGKHRLLIDVKFPDGLRFTFVSQQVVQGTSAASEASRRVWMALGSKQHGLQVDPEGNLQGLDGAKQ